MKKRQMEKFIKAQYFLAIFLFLTYFFLIIGQGIFNIYNVEYSIEDIVVPVIMIGTTVFFFFMSIVFPRLYPTQWEEYYRKPMRENPKVRHGVKVMLALFIVFVLMGAILNFILLYPIYTTGFNPNRDNEYGIFVFFMDVFFLSATSLFFALLRK